MNRSELAEAIAVLGRILDALAETPGDRSTAAAADLRYRIGALRAGAEAALKGAALGSALFGCFDAARLAGAALEAVGRVRAVAEAEAPAGLAGVAVAQGAVQCALIQESRILAATAFVSREDVDAALVRVNAAFAPAVEYAADAHDGAAYQAVIALHAAVVRDLAERGRRLPRRVGYSFARTVPALALANRLYGDAGRAGELVAENKVAHPLFMPGSGRALSA